VPRTKRESRKRLIRVFISVIIIVGAACIAAYLLKSHPISISKETEWAIGIYQGDSIFNLSPVPEIRNPVLRASDVTDVKAEYVADPFMVQAGDAWFMFFEVMNSLNNQGDIGCATSQDGLLWKYERIILNEPFHLSYPYVFQWEGQFYMIPESAEGGAIRLYRAEQFPYSWTFMSDLLKGAYSDTCVFRKDGTWWMLTCSKPYQHDELRLFFADRLTGPWTEHPASPVVSGDPKKAQCGGRIIIDSGAIIRFAHDDFPTYGKKVLAFIISELSRTKYAEKEYEGNPVLSAHGRGWNRHGMHHIDAHEVSPRKWIAAVDGYRKQYVFRIEY
jgi:hypothetical protein